MDPQDLRVPMHSRTGLIVTLAAMVMFGGGAGWATAQWIGTLSTYPTPAAVPGAMARAPTPIATAAESAPIATTLPAPTTVLAAATDARPIASSTLASASAVSKLTTRSRSAHLGAATHGVQYHPARFHGLARVATIRQPNRVRRHGKQD